MEIIVDDTYCEESFSPFRHRVLHALYTAAAMVGVPCDARMSIIFVDEAEIREINAQTRAIDKTTDVLSFPMLRYEDAERGAAIKWEGHTLDRDPQSGALLLGDVLLCWPVIRAQAAEYGHGILRECAYLAVHGLLHLLGYDHMTPAQEEEMTAMAQNIMDKADIARGNDNDTGC